MESNGYPQIFKAKENEFERAILGARRPLGVSTVVVETMWA